jgi:hypothetical protein
MMFLVGLMLPLSFQYEKEVLLWPVDTETVLAVEEDQGRHTPTGESRDEKIAVSLSGGDNLPEEQVR